VAVGQAARQAGLPLAETIVFYLQAFAGNLVTIACRIVPIGASEGQRVLAAIAPDIAAVVEVALPGDLSALGGSCVAGDTAAMMHETQRVRIFRS
jgi:urease accessory protein